jgi:hypothetical protein
VDIKAWYEYSAFPFNFEALLNFILDRHGKAFENLE